MKKTTILISAIILTASTEALYSQNDKDIPASDTASANIFLEKSEKFFTGAKYDSTIFYSIKAGVIFEKGKIWSKYVRCLNKTGEALCKMGRYDSSAAILNKSLLIGSDKLGEKNIEVARTYHIFGTVFGETGKNNKAMDFFQKSLSIKIALLGEKNEDVARSYNNIGAIYFRTANYPKALETHKKALEIWLAIYGEGDYRTAQSYNSIGNVYNILGEFDKALGFYWKALAIRLSTLGEKHPDVGSTYNGMARAFQGKCEYDSALVYLQKALANHIGALGERHPAVATVYDNIGFNYFCIGDYNTAIHYFELVLAINLATLGDQSPQAGGSYIHLANTYCAKGEFDKAFQYYQHGLPILLSSTGEKNLTVAEPYANLGLIYTEKGDYDKALQFNQKSLLIYTAILGQNHLSVADAYSNIGSVYLNTHEYQKSLEQFQKALTIKLAILGEKHPDVAYCYKDIANVYSELGEHDRALEIYQKALGVQLEILDKTNPYVAETYASIGIAYSRKGEQDKALEFHHKALSIRTSLYGSKHPEISDSYRELGRIYLDTNNPTLALEYIQRSIVSLAEDFDDTLVYANPAPSGKCSSDLRMLTTLELKAEALETRYRDNSKNLKDLEAALAIYELGSSIINKLRSGYQSESSQLRLGEQASKIYSRAISAALQMFRVTHEARYKAKAFDFSETGKASILLQSIAEPEAKQFAGIPDSLLKVERDLKVDIAYYGKNLFDEQSKGEKARTSKIAEWQNTLFTLNRQYDSLTHRFENEYPEYFNLKYNNSTISSKEIQKRILRDDDALIEYFLGDASVTIFTLTRKQLDVTSVKRDSLFEMQVRGMKEGLVQRNYELYTANAYALYRLLIEPINSKIAGKDLIVIPDGILGYIPFETLITKKPDKGGKDYRQLAYLIKDHQIAYDYSSTLLYENRVHGRKKSIGRYVGFAPVTFK